MKIPRWFLPALAIFAAYAGATAAAPAEAARTSDGVPLMESSSFRLHAMPSLRDRVYGAHAGEAGGALVSVGGVLSIPETGLDPTGLEFAPRARWLEPLPPLTQRQRGWNRILRSLGRDPAPPEDTREWRSAAIGTPVAFGASASGGDFFYVVGGISSDGMTDRVVRYSFQELIELHAEEEEPEAEDLLDPQVYETLVTETLPPLPEPLALAGAAVMGNRLYVAGGIRSLDGEPSNRLYRLDLATALDPVAPGESAWETIDMPYASGVVLPTLTVRRDEVAIADALFLLGGLVQAGEGWAPAGEGWKYLPPWESHAGWSPLREAPASAVLTESLPVGPSHVVLAGKRRTGGPLSLAEALRPPGDNADVVLKAYHTFTDRWAALPWPELAVGEPRLVRTGRDFLFSGYDPGTGELAFRRGELTHSERHFSMWDYFAMLVYLGVLIAIGRYFARKEAGTEFFFLGGRRIPWWAAGLSIYATGVSAISFMAIPAKTYATDWLYFIGQAVFPTFTVLIAAFYFIPLLRRLEITTVMEYFDLRFGRGVRYLMSAVAVLGQVAGRMSITLLLPSLALTAVTGMDLFLCILLMGILATIYTVMGGISAVIWTDVLQVVVLFGGALLSFVIILMNVDGGFGQMMDLAVENNKFNLVDLRLDLTTATMWVMLLWAVADVFGKGLGQEGLQRAFSTKDVRSARRAMITVVVVALPASFLFYGIGTALFAFYSANPERLNPTLQTDGIFPLFIAQQLPIGIAGLVVSGLFAASMSTLDTAMNSVSAIVTRDFYSAFRKGATEREQMKLARWITVACGVLGTGIALWMASFENLGSLWDMFSIILGLIGGGLGGVGALALLTTRANQAGTLLGAVVTAVFILWIRFYTDIHFFIYGTLSLFCGFAAGYLFSLLFPAKPIEELDGLTLWTGKSGVDPEESDGSPDSRGRG
ncbi:MAG: sodium:solute symporter [Opitutales bacterium]|nr:sodium:solute symporter [Opitutales bacterium]